MNRTLKPDLAFKIGYVEGYNDMADFAATGKHENGYDSGWLCQSDSGCLVKP